jgi:hypothetical protein
LGLLAATLFAAGLTVVTLGIIESNPARSAGGACLTITGLTFFALAVLRRWITDTARERERHLDAARALQDEQTKYIAAQAALELERERVRRDAAAEHQQNIARLQAEREALEDQFEDKRAQLICETFETAVRMERAGLLDDEPQQHETARVIGLFPQAARERAAEPEQARARDRDARRF